MKNKVFIGLLSAILGSVPALAYDPGGNVLDYYGMVSQGNQYHSRVAIYGVCASACTMKLGSNNLCIDPSATLLFHQATDNRGVRSVISSNIMLDMYPKNIRNWVVRNGALYRNEVTAMSGVEAIRMGIRSCSH